MKNLSLITILSLCLICCGEPTEENVVDPLLGTWVVEINQYCALGITFDNLYELDFICELQSGAFGIETEIGEWTVSTNEKTGEDNKITFRPTVTSCPRGEYDNEVMYYDFLDDVLRLFSMDGFMLSLERLGDFDPVPMTGLYGCWEGDYFYQNEIVEIHDATQSKTVENFDHTRIYY